MSYLLRYFIVISRLVILFPETWPCCHPIYYVKKNGIIAPERLAIGTTWTDQVKKERPYSLKDLTDKPDWSWDPENT